MAKEIDEKDKIDKDEIKGLEKGPTSDRGCTDIIFCLLMIAVFAFQAYLMYYGFNNGDPKKIITFYDKNNIPCGNKNDVGDAT